MLFATSTQFDSNSGTEKGDDFWHDPDAEGIYIKINGCSPEWRRPEQRARLIALTACHLISDMREDLEILYHRQTQIYKI